MIDETLGNYRIVSLIGEGGMGVVYRAEHTLLGRKAAVKVLRSQISEEAVQRFFNEARAAASLHHPSCVEVFDFGHRPDGSAYIIMELLEGEPLSDRMDRETRLPVGIAAAIGRQVASALHVAHKQGIIHRDLKPGNIYLVPDPEAPAGVRAKVLDFGIAKLARDPVPRSVKTNSGAVFGTPRYMSPEQCRNARSVDGRSDVYSLGCILYEMLLGVAPFDYDSWGELVGAHLHETPPRPTDLDKKLPLDVETVLLTALAKNPEERYQNMHEFAQAIETVWRLHGNARVPFTPPAGVRAISLDDTVPPDEGTSSSPHIPVTSSSPRISSPQHPTPQRASSPEHPTPRISAGSSARIVVPATTDDTEPPPMPPGRSSPRLAAAGTDPGSSQRISSPMAIADTAGPARLALADTEPPRNTPSTGNPPVAAMRASEPGVLAQRIPVVWIAASVLFVLGAGVLIWSLGRSSGKQDSDVVAVVDHRDESGGSQAAVAIDAGVATVVPPDAAVAVQRKPPPRDPNETDTAQLTRTFGRQTPAVQTCFRDHPKDAAGALSIRIKIDVSGKVTSAEVLPAELAATPLGACLADVARKTEFGPQPKPAAFRVPIRAVSRGP